MKNFKTNLMVLFLLASMTFISCSSGDGGIGGDAGSGIVKAKVDGVSISSIALLTQANKVTAGSSSTLTMQGTNMDGKGFNFVVNNFTGVGTYTIGGSSSVFVTGNYVEGNAQNPLNTSLWSTPYDNTTKRGEISFSEVTATNVKGTFQFTAKNPKDSSVKQITEGSFNVSVKSF